MQPLKLGHIVLSLYPRNRAFNSRGAPPRCPVLHSTSRHPWRTDQRLSHDPPGPSRASAHRGRLPGCPPVHSQSSSSHLTRRNIGGR